MTVATGASVALFWQSPRRTSVRQALAGSLAFFSGLITAGLGLGHLSGVLVVELRRSPFHYDFRVYALLLLGATLVAMGARLATASARVARGEHAAWGPAIGAATALLAINLPLAPIQGFAVALSIFVSIGLVALLAVRARLAS
ncbi:MAG: hypothetical protein ACRD2N_01215 [Vicinamibacterales bacterium]